MTEYPKRLIEVDLPIKRISVHARREKSIRHGHIATLHIWWARRPLAACRAVLLAALLPDPADPNCPEVFRQEAAAQMRALRDACGGPLRDWNNPLELRAALLDFIADFSNWSLTNATAYLETSRTLVQVAHESLGGTRGTRPLVIDPFAGGGTIPIEALRIGADAFASDLNPVPVLLNRVLLEYVPAFGARLADAVERWGTWIGVEAGKILARAYPREPRGGVSICYVWARTILSEDPSGGTTPVEVPLIRSMWLSKTRGQLQVLRWKRDGKGHVLTTDDVVHEATGRAVQVRRPILELVEPSAQHGVDKGTSSGGAATCPVTGYTTSVESVRTQLSARRGGASDARLICVVTARTGERGRHFRAPMDGDLEAVSWAKNELERLIRTSLADDISLVPDEPLNHIRGFFNVPLYGMKVWGDLFSPRQALSLVTLARLVTEAGVRIEREDGREFAVAVQTCLALALGKQADSNSSLCSWRPTSLDIGHTFGRQALPMMWDFAEANVIGGSTRDWSNAVEGGLKALRSIDVKMHGGHAAQASATRHPLPDDAAHAFVTDPPYYAAVPYADLSDFFYVWLKRAIGARHPDLFRESTSPKTDELVSLGHRAAMYREKNNAWFEKRMGEACGEGRRVLSPHGIGVVVFASKETEAWEAMLGALIDSGWVVTASWPIDTEMGTRLRARNSATLASSVHIVCRPRETPTGMLEVDTVGDWRDVLAELPRRIHDWMPRLATEGIVGADAIFACLGPALEVFSRFSRVEKASGGTVKLKEYLEHVWAAVAREALVHIFHADTTSFEADARVTAMWLWTISTGGADTGDKDVEVDEDNEDAAPDASTGPPGFTLEYDAARKIAQGLGAHLEQLTSLIEVRGSTARLLPVAERTRTLFNKSTVTTARGKGQSKKKSGQLSLGFEADLAEAEEAGAWGDTGAPQKGDTVLDRVHQSMILFGAGRGEALKRFLVDDGAGRDDRFWRLAQALSALYPPATYEKRWIDGVLARKKGIGL